MAALDNGQKRELCWLIASRLPAGKIVAHFLEKYSIEVSRLQVSQYKTGKNSKKWVNLIEQFREEYDAAVAECHFSSKRNRLNALYKAYEVAELKKDAKGMVMAVAQAQKEMEGTKIQLTGKDGEEFSFNINIGPPPQQQKEVTPPLKVLPSAANDL